MSVAPSSDKVLNPSFSHPKQVKLLGATVKGVGVITAVSARPANLYVLIEDEQGREHHRFVSTLERSDVVFAAEIPLYRRYTRRVGYGVWDDVLELTVPGTPCPSCEGGSYLTAMGTPDEALERCERCGGLGKVEELEVAA